MIRTPPAADPKNAKLGAQTLTSASGNQPVQILGICGSLRAKSLNRNLLTLAGELAPQGVSVEIFDLLPIPLYNADVERQGAPEAVAALKAAIAAADAVIFACPEYNASPTAALKNAIDWASRRPTPDVASVLAGKPAAIVGGGGRRGTVRAQAQLKQTLASTRMELIDDVEVALAGLRGNTDENGMLTNQEYRDLVGSLVQAVADQVREKRAAAVS